MATAIQDCMPTARPDSSTTGPELTENPTPSPIAGTATKAKSYRGPSFTPLEDAAVAKAWIAVSEDPVVGAEQKGDDFFQAITDVYNSKYKPANREQRTLTSILKREKLINKMSMKFGACFLQVTRAKPTGVSPQDMRAMATALFNGMEMKTATDDCGAPFKYELAWDVLRKHPKFIADLEDKSCQPQGRNVSTDHADSSPIEVNGIVPAEYEGTASSKSRPTGRRKAKELLKRDEMARKKLKITENALEAQETRNRILQEHCEILTFAKSPAGCDESDAVEYFNILQKRALRHLRESQVDGEEGEWRG